MQGNETSRRNGPRSRWQLARGNDEQSARSAGARQGHLLDLAVRFGPKLLVAILIMTVGFFVAGWVGRATLRGLRRLDLEPPVRQLLTRVARVLVVGLFAIMALQNLGVAGELNLSLVGELRQRGIGIPYPQMEVRLIGGDAQTQGTSR